MPETTGHFQLLEPIGRGTLGELHRARDLRHGRTVALRLIAPVINDDEQLRLAVLDGARSVSEVSHPAITAVYDCGEEGSRAWVASEFVPGQKLSTMVSGAALHPTRALDLAVAMADGLAVAHSHGLDHGALTTDVVLVTPKGAAKILDVGMFDWTTAHGSSRQNDLAGLGAVLFEMLVGRPLKRGWPAELRLSEIPPDVQPILVKLTTTNPREQYASMAVAASALRDVLLARTTTTGYRAGSAPVSSTPGRAPARTFVLGAALLLAVATLWLVFSRW